MEVESRESSRDNMPSIQVQTTEVDTTQVDVESQIEPSRVESETKVDTTIHAMEVQPQIDNFEAEKQ